MKKSHYVYNEAGCCKQLTPCNNKEQAIKLVNDKRFNFIYIGFTTEDEVKKKVKW